MTTDPDIQADIRTIKDAVSHGQAAMTRAVPAIVRVCNAAARLAESAEPDLTDPNVVHVNMLRGTVAKPTEAQIEHLYGRPLAEPTEAGKGEVQTAYDVLNARFPESYIGIPIEPTPAPAPEMVEVVAHWLWKQFCPGEARYAVQPEAYVPGARSLLALLAATPSAQPQGDRHG